MFIRTKTIPIMAARPFARRILSSSARRLPRQVYFTSIPQTHGIQPHVQPRTTPTPKRFIFSSSSAPEWHSPYFMEDASTEEKEEWLNSLIRNDDERLDSQAYLVVLKDLAQSNQSGSPHTAEEWMRKLECCCCQASTTTTTTANGGMLQQCHSVLGKHWRRCFHIRYSRGTMAFQTWKRCKYRILQCISRFVFERKGRSTELCNCEKTCYQGPRDARLHDSNNTNSWDQILQSFQTQNPSTM